MPFRKEKSILTILAFLRSSGFHPASIAITIDMRIFFSALARIDAVGNNIVGRVDSVKGVEGRGVVHEKTSRRR
jgi:hypothetical protein